MCGVHNWGRLWFTSVAVAAMTEITAPGITASGCFALHCQHQSYGGKNTALQIYLTTSMKLNF